MGEGPVHSDTVEGAKKRYRQRSTCHYECAILQIYNGVVTLSLKPWQTPCCSGPIHEVHLRTVLWGLSLCVLVVFYALRREKPYSRINSLLGQELKPRLQLIRKGHEETEAEQCGNSSCVFASQKSIYYKMNCKRLGVHYKFKSGIKCATEQPCPARAEDGPGRGVLTYNREDLNPITSIHRNMQACWETLVIPVLGRWPQGHL